MPPADASLVLLLCLGLLTSTRLALADGSVGCLFSKNVCKPKLEWCFDDYAFGRCLSRYEDDEDMDLYRYDLNGKSLQVLRGELERLMALGYRWTHFYTQCVVKALLTALRYESEYDVNSCRVFAEEDYRTVDESLERMDPRNVGQVQFMPSVVNPHAEFADEIYLPELGRNVFANEAILPEKAEESYINGLRKILLLKQLNKDKRDKNPFEITEFEEGANENIFPKYMNEPSYEDTPFRGIRHFLDGYNTPDQFRSGLESRDLDVEKLTAKDQGMLKSFSRNYNTPGKFRKGQETRDEVVYPRDYQMNYLTHPNGYFYPEDRQFTYDVFSSGEVENAGRGDDGVYTEGGVVYLRGGRKDDLNDPAGLDLMDVYNNWGFKRPERLDVKKPGPSFSTNNYAFHKADEKDGKESKEIEKAQPKPEKQKSVLSAKLEKKKVGSPMESPTLRKLTTTMAPVKEKTPLGKGEGGGYAYIELKTRVNSWQEGSRIVRKLEDFLRLSPNTFSNVKVDQNEVRFRVGPNRRNLNSSDIVGRIENSKDLIQKAIGVEVVAAGVGEQNKLLPSKSLLGGDERQLWILSFLLCGVIAAIAIVGAAFFVIKRHSHTREKLQNLSQLDTEASKDYQDLCRARMASKAAQEKPEGTTTTGHRISNLTREPEGSNHSPSSRSSTSSWSEEPALTNMDISTGHMVLSYMEDHLENKDRLEQEWIALCAYEAEPCATTIAAKGENASKNRYGDVLPYDHARVVLNELSNISGSDYINASTITDHDPRNPAYIATQGPLASTAADFWQMIWEQGSVVMVMLTRLTENGTAMCHRYWPEEGSQLYHIYEVHLVSEHIWCDDYLVRSFYLKNLKTGETRTVTQFHFLSWPENGIPLSTKALLEFRRKVNKSYRGRSCPIVVHCSDGVGRTGTYCLIDMVLNRMGKGAKEIDIAATLEHIRDQRPLMVRTKQQFEFVLMAVAEEVHAILRALPTNPNHSPPPVVKEKE